MASTSTSTSSRPTFVLPSIREMFPEHLMPCSAPRTHSIPIPPPIINCRYSASQPNPTPSFSFDVLKSDPRRSSLQHIASSRQDLPPVRTALAQPGRARSFSGHSAADFEMEVDEEEREEGDGVDGVEAPEAKKHVCPTCRKRFNRPSSLRIHRNTHTGATPFRCPYPPCGRQFNVNSNMRRHFRNHSISAYAPWSSSTSSRISPSSPSSSSSEKSSTSSPSSHASFSPPSCTSSHTSPPGASWRMPTSLSSSRYSPTAPPPPRRWGKDYCDGPA
ncbi:hypothetical protein C8R47DRAFT_110263 [Mycena vitilis]|nr:hypothetical protein C8R47DRAFT_110263 [Mycena vitilis]